MTVYWILIKNQEEIVPKSVSLSVNIKLYECRGSVGVAFEARECFIICLFQSRLSRRTCPPAATIFGEVLFCLHASGSWLFSFGGMIPKKSSQYVMPPPRCKDVGRQHPLNFSDYCSQGSQHTQSPFLVSDLTFGCYSSRVMCFPLQVERNFFFFFAQTVSPGRDVFLIRRRRGAMNNCKGI